MRILILTCIFCLWTASIFGQAEAEPTSGCAPLNGVQFTSNYPGATNVNWDFGDGGSSGIDNPEHTFINPGTYTVSFTASFNGNNINESILIEVFGNPTAAFAEPSPNQVCVGDAVVFQDQSTGSGGAAIVDWEWTFGDGGFFSGSSNPTYEYTLVGQFNVALIVTDVNGCTSSVSVSDAVAVSDGPTVIVSHFPAGLNSCEAPFLVDFNSLATNNSPLGGPLTYEWVFGNGETFDNADPSVITYDTGNYNVLLTVTDAFGCATDVVRNVNVANVTAGFSVPDTVCSLVEFELDEDYGAWIFDFGDGSSPDDTLEHAYAQEGTYNVTLSVGQSGCTVTETQSIFVQVPTFEIESDPSLLCAVPAVYDLSINSSYEFVQTNFDEFWDELTLINTSNGAIVTVDYDDSNPYLMTGSNQYTVSASATTAFGCSAFADYDIQLYVPYAFAVPDTASGCAPLTITWDDQSSSFDPIVEWEWTFPEETIVQTGNGDISYTFEEPGEYEVFFTVTNSEGCTDQSFIYTIEVGVPTPGNFGYVPDEICIGDPLELVDFGSDPNIDDWHVGSSDDGPILITLYNGCVDTTLLDLTVNGPFSGIDFSCDCDSPFDFFFELVGNAESRDIDFGDGTTISNTTQTTFSHSYPGSGDYVFSVVSYAPATGCPATQSSVLVQVRDLDATIVMDDHICKQVPYPIVIQDSEDVDLSCSGGYIVDWGDGTTPSMSANDTLTHVFQTHGDYVVSLLIEDVNGCKDTISHDLQVVQLDVDIAQSLSFGCLPIEVDFDAIVTADTTVVSYLYDFGDGNTSILSSDTNIFDEPIPLDNNGEPAPWVILLTVQDTLGCISSDSVTVSSIEVGASFVSNEDPGLCLGDLLSFSPTPDNDLFVYLWDFGDGNFSSEIAPTHEYVEPGDYTVSLTITAEDGCTAQSTEPSFVSVQSYPVAEIFSETLSASVLCYPLQALFTDSTSYFGSAAIDPVWDLGNGSPVTAESTVGTTYEAPGTYTVSLTTSTTNGCLDQDVVDIQVVGPIADLGLDVNEICKGDDITFTMSDTTDVWVWEWDFGDGIVSSGGNPVTHTYNFNPPSGQTQASLTVWSLDSACAISYQEPVFIDEVIADFARNNEFLSPSPQDTAHCDNIFDLFLDESLGASSWQWDFGNGQTSTQQNPAEINYAPGEYTVTLFIENDQGCTDTIQKEMLIFPMPDPLAVGGSICLGESIELLADGGVSYAWSPPDGLSNTQIANPIATPQQSIVYVVEVSNEFECTESTTVEVEVFQPLPPFSEDSTIVIGETIAVNLPPGISGYTYDWNPDLWTTCNDCPNPILQPLEDIVYTITVSDPQGCFDQEYVYQVTVLPLTSVDMPDAFTPNGDGINDVVYVRGWGIEELLAFEIYNRWGELIFSTSDLEEGWDGTYKGELQGSETFAYVVQVKNYFGETMELTGFIDILR